LKWLNEIALHIDARWTGLDAVLLPGGFLYLAHYVGNLVYAERVRRLDDLARVVDAVACLNRSPGAVIVAGVDSDGPNDDVGGDQLCVAWNGVGVVGVGRKIFPVRGNEADDLICYVEDFSASSRIVTLRNGYKAILCACYDGYAVKKRDQALHITDWKQSVKWIANIGPDPRNCRIAGTALSGLIQNFSDLICKNAVGTALVAIHSTPVGRWQTQGIQGASAKLNNGAGDAYGAIHFTDSLPSSPEKSPLSAGAGRRRAMADWFTLGSEGGTVLVRLFQ
jgi:hypothetical protein